MLEYKTVKSYNHKNGKYYTMYGYKPSISYIVNKLYREFGHSTKKALQEIRQGKYDNVLICNPLSSNIKL